ncbi:hypothetical protein BKP45_21060 [Anaerobacillus alkalidiazotrophicus]|uniref:GmrSD restriction endonucleases N-terminal domain-containing protein n=1 Tax=Anaerobacillus alkalidiazotrophicus TaxID=472963 RepID=A0A1S2LVH2_9BACI|nr:DUF262 domain-containing protein [Anaerobacillus alkalidiazotrophicus]OIJ16499.1 hypothetical protein BKP45_21060 [Anaerobacillus alkalidiazotrophicus]
MRLLPSDPDIQTIVARIEGSDINLQPDFQRGEVWGEPKKRRLIDSILREWHVPPIHVVEVKETAKQDVLDGQQRLAAIRDFVNGDIVVDGYTQPEDPEIVQLDGLSYEGLPEKWRRKFDQFTIRVFKIIDYKPEEPGELFYRLNQPANLTAAEQRNAFFGPARQQVKELAKSMEDAGLTSTILGFSNSRMAYDDVIAKVCFALDRETLVEKITGAKITNKYRTQEEFSESSYYRVEQAIKLMGESSDHFHSEIKFNKATLFSWLCFLASLEKNESEINSKIIGEFISLFEKLRSRTKENVDPTNYPILIEHNSLEDHILDMFNDRASSRAADVSSVLIRDIALWLILSRFMSTVYPDYILKSNNIKLISEKFPQEKWVGAESKVIEQINNFIEDTNWGSDL